MRRLVGAAAIVLLVVGCGGGEKTSETPAMDTTAAAAPPPAPVPAPPTDAEIAHIVVTDNTVDIDAAEQAKAKSQNADVKKFSQTMITDHTALNKAAEALAKKLNVTPADNPPSQSLKSTGDAAKAEIGAKTGADFDKAYAANEVVYHQALLDALNNTLLPNAQNPEIKALLEKAKPVVEQHLKMSQDLKTKLGA